MHGACGMSYFFGNGDKTKKNSEIEKIKKVIFAIHEIDQDGKSAFILSEKFVDTFNKLTPEEKIERARNGSIFNDPDTGHLYPALTQLSGQELHAICQKLEIPTYWAK